MKWGELKEYVEVNGVNNDTEVAFEDPNFGGNLREITLMDIYIDNGELRIEPPYWEPVD
jgi:hypothetical protein